MRIIQKTCLSILLVMACSGLYGQTGNGTVKKNFIFSAITGKEGRIDSTRLPVSAKSVSFDGGDSRYFKLAYDKKRKLIVSFIPAAGFTGIARSAIRVKDAAGKSIAAIKLTGLATKGLEGENEAPLADIIDVLGYKVYPGWKGLANNCLPALQGEEIDAALFLKAGTGNVEMIPVARYSPDFELPFGYYSKNTGEPVKHEAGILRKQQDYPEHQTLYPQLAAGTGLFDPGKTAFGFYAVGPTHTAYSENEWNAVFHPSNVVHATRIYPLKDKAGKLLPNQYLVCFEEATNGDYNDYVFLVKNIKPAANPFTALFNGKNLDGWDMFLNKIGKNTDPHNNFTVTDSSLFVSGKDLGYVITKNGYSNYHFKVDFKWGEKKWPPREKDKRDAGICYNIPVNEPDSVWPQSIECQIQEGDVGDFWLLGFSTIKVKGVQNVPANHTRMVKQKDAEKTYVDWNTVEVISYKGKCIHIVNGVIVNAGEEASVKEGRILLQSEYSEIYYRNVLIRQL